MKFRTSTFQDPSEDGPRPTLSKVSTMPVLRDRKSMGNLNTDVAPASDGPRSAASEPPRTPALLRKKRSKSYVATAPTEGSGEAAPREDVPSVPSMPMKYLKRKLSRPNVNANGGGSESSGDAPDVPPPPPLPTTSSFLLKRRQSRPNPEEAEWTPGDDGKIVSKRDVLRGFLSRKGTTMNSKSAKLETKRLQNAKVAAERTSPIQRRAADGSNAERPQTAREDRRPSKPFDMRNASRSPSQAPSGNAPARPTESPAELAKKLLSMEQVRAMSVGAPCFGVEECNGRYKPQVIFRGTNAETSAEFAKDYTAFGHASFAACTLGLEERKDGAEELVFEDDDSDSSKPFDDLMEIPSMLGSHGLDPGTVGFEYFLQMPIADGLSRADETDVSDKRELLASAPGELGLRPLNIEVLIYRLTELGQLYAASKEQSLDYAVRWGETKIEEMGVELFGKLLTSDSWGNSASVPMSMQIRALQRVLRTSGLWRDFGLVEWRNKLGQLLWEAESAESNRQEGSGVCERDVLLLQIALAAELLVRLNVVRLMSTCDPILSRRDLKVLERQRTAKINWDLLLAERFLENVDICANMTSGLGHAADRSSLISAIPFLSTTDASDDEVDSLQPLLTPKHGETQLEGLRYFSKALHWPHADDLPRRMDEVTNLPATRKRFSRVPSTYLTPMSTPQLPSRRGSHNSTFGIMEAEQPAFSKAATAEDMQLVPVRTSSSPNLSFDACGWLSRSWLSGLVMPGEAASQFLISTLLENSPQAMSVLGSGANPYGGFHYQGRSYWSKGSVVGRVMAAKKGATECMDWVSVPALPNAPEDGWMKVVVKEMPDAKLKPRITNPEAVARDSDLLRNKGLLGSARQGDFTWPNDDLPILSHEVVCQGLSFKDSIAVSSAPGGGTTITTKPPKNRSVATLTFSSTIKRKLTVVEIPLLYDATFISSYPCHPRTAKSTPPPPPPTLTRPSPRPALSPFPLSSMEHHGNNKENKERASSRSPTEGQRPRTAPGPADSGYASKQTSASTISFAAFKDEILAVSPSTSSRASNSPGGATLTPIHPLHIDYHYDIVPLTTLFTAAAATETRPRALSSGADCLPQQTPEVAQTAAAKEVMVLDCRGGEDLELFARAWCAKVGEHAIVAKQGRTCLACSVREARAVGVCVVLRT